VATGYDRAGVLYELAQLQSIPAEADDLFRRTLAEYRRHLSGVKNRGGQHVFYARVLRGIAGRFASRYPDEAEKLLDESIALYKEICGPSPYRRRDSYNLTETLLDQAHHMRRVVAGQAGNANGAKAAGLVAKIETLFQEAVQSQRYMVSRFAPTQDRDGLVRVLQEESEYLLGLSVDAGVTGGLLTRASEDAAARKLKADALLTEAIQLCRQLNAEFPGDAIYTDRLAALLKLQAQHFGQQKDIKQEDIPNQ